MARHRSPQGRRAHLGPPLTASVAAAGVGAHRSIPVHQLARSTPARFVATVVAGGALAAAGQQALAAAVPVAGDGATVLRLGVEELLGVAPQAAAVTNLAASNATAQNTTGQNTTGQNVTGATAGSAAQPLTHVAPVAAEPVVVDATDLVKAADLQRAAAEATAQTPAAEAARVAEQAAAQAQKPAQNVVAAASGAVQMIVGRVTSGFGARWGTSHQGLDIAAPIGTPIRAPLAGTVIDSGPASGFGLWVRVRHADGTITVYGHINRSLVKVGEKVAAGEVIAEVGNRGHSTGPHLHIEVITPGGQKINPRPWLDQHGISY